MGEKMIDNVHLGKTWTTYIASVEGALKAADFWHGDISQLMGMTGAAFHFIIHKLICPSSVTVYDWAIEHFEMMDRIGIHSRIIHVINDNKGNTFDLIRKDAIDEIKKSINNNIPVVIWAPSTILEFGLIKGYHDKDKVFYISDCMMEDPDPLLYDNLGRSEVPILFIQLFKKKIDVDYEKIVRDSLKFGLEQWFKAYHINPDYKSGLAGYNNMINALMQNEFNHFGLSYILAVYADAKNHLVNYLSDIVRRSKLIKNIKTAVQLYQEIADNFKQMADLIPFKGSQDFESKKENIDIVLKLTMETKELEGKAIEIINKALH